MTEFAKKIGVSVNTYQHYEYGKRAPSLDFIQKIYHVLGVSSDWLLGLTEERAPGVSITTGDGSAVAAQSPGANVAATSGSSPDVVPQLVETLNSQQKVIAKLTEMVSSAIPHQLADNPQDNSLQTPPGPPTVNDTKRWRPKNW